MATEAPLARVCKGCRVKRELKEYAVYQDGRLSNFCTSCEGTSDNLIVSPEVKALDRRERAVISHMLTRLGNSDKSLARINAPHVSEMFASVVNKFGGVDEISDIFHQFVTAVRAKDPTDKRILSAMKLLYGLAEASTKQLPQTGDLGQLSDDELQAEFERQMLIQLRASTPNQFISPIEDDLYGES